MTIQDGATSATIPNPVERLGRDIRSAATTLTHDEARFLVDAYYTMQDGRIRAEGQIRSIDKGEKPEPHMILDWLAIQNRTLEDQIKTALDRYSLASPVGEWARSIIGVGPVIAAGLLAHIDITRAPTVGHIWAFAGLDPTKSWEKKTRRPWNAKLKVLCWKLGESFTKQQNNKADIYGKVFVERKAYETAKNLNGDYADQAAHSLETKNFKPSTLAWWWYSAMLTPAAAAELQKMQQPSVAAAKKLHEKHGPGVAMLPPGRINLRAQRYAVKLFLAHLHEVWFKDFYGEAPPLPYPIAHLGHAHHIPAPNTA